MGHLWKFVMVVALGAAPVAAQAPGEKQPTQQVISRAESRKAEAAPADRFTGTVHVTPLFAPTPPARASAGSVTFTKGARSAWHRHPLGQWLIVTVGVGLTQSQDGETILMKAGDVVWCPPNVRHWHGATLSSTMTHIAVQEMLDGKNVEWMEKVTDTEYKEAVTAASAS